jgi:hypothetical protein
LQQVVAVRCDLQRLLRDKVLAVLVSEETQAIHQMHRSVHQVVPQTVLMELVLVVVLVYQLMDSLLAIQGRVELALWHFVTSLH